MATNKKCRHNTVHFRFDMPVNHEAIFCGNMSIEGFGCMTGAHADADIDSVEYEGVEIKPVLELLGGMYSIDCAAKAHVKGLFEVSQVPLLEEMA